MADKTKIQWCDKPLDSADEFDFLCKCFNCGITFRGSKRRMFCGECEKKLAKKASRRRIFRKVAEWVGYCFLIIAGVWVILNAIVYFNTPITLALILKSSWAPFLVALIGWGILFWHDETPVI